MNYSIIFNSNHLKNSNCILINQYLSNDINESLISNNPEIEFMSLLECLTNFNINLNLNVMYFIFLFKASIRVMVISVFDDDECNDKLILFQAVQLFNMLFNILFKICFPL